LCAPNLPHLQADLLFSLVSENVRDYAIFLMDEHGVIQCWGESARLMKWWTRQQAEGAHLRLLYPDGGSEDGTAESHLEAAADTGEYNGEGHRIRSDGTTFWAYVTLTALRNGDGVLVGFAKVTRDFSARRAVEAGLARQRPAAPELQRLLEEAGRMRRLVATLSHELRTPLTAILGSIALVERQIGEGDRAHIDRLQRNGRHLLGIVDDVLQMSQAESGQLALSTAARRLGPAIEEALADVETQAAARNLTLTNSVSGAAADLPYWGDEGRVRQIPGQPADERRQVHRPGRANHHQRRNRRARGGRVAVRGRALGVRARRGHGPGHSAGAAGNDFRAVPAIPAFRSAARHRVGSFNQPAAGPSDGRRPDSAERAWGRLQFHCVAADCAVGTGSPLSRNGPLPAAEGTSQ
jgi:PAS domain S-box-containing protein